MKAREAATAKPRKKDDPEQSKRFMEMAEELDCDQRVRPFERILSKLFKPNKTDKQHPK